MALRTAIGALVLVAAFTGTVAAEPFWKGAAWYVVADTIVGPFVWKGPYASREECEGQLPANEEDADYACEYLSEQPDWDN